ncbi:MAG: ABC transporter permease subunit [Halobacteriovoraceae bacterium]|nr:ABC transporter permease subunit [Halobacteriovoraceae bacterium]
MMEKKVKYLFLKEFKSYFKSPLGYVFLVIFLFGIGHLTFELGRGSFFYVREASLSPFFRYIPWIFLFLIPAVSMRLWAEERKSGTIELLLTMPITIEQAVIAKFLASWAFIGIALMGTFPMIFTVIYLGNPDLSVIFLGYLASFLTAGGLLSLGVFFFALTKNQVTSFILTVVATLLFLMAGSPPILEFISSFFPDYIVNLFESLSILNHFESMERGVLGFSDLWFYVVMIVCWHYGCVYLIKENKAN